MLCWQENFKMILWSSQTIYLSKECFKLLHWTIVSGKCKALMAMGTDSNSLEFSLI